MNQKSISGLRIGFHFISERIEASMRENCFYHVVNIFMRKRIFVRMFAIKFCRFQMHVWSPLVSNFNFLPNNAPGRLFETFPYNQQSTFGRIKIF